ncbi:MAG TPA: sensor histidine kinase [Nocardioides sp.]|uniref:sensor histidine kinase n=1 Tax=Nocardioides sp. TaxID=35761 RepID=UPI002F40EA5F
MQVRPALAALVGVAGVVLGVVAQHDRDGALNLASAGLMYAAYLVVGLLILRAQPRHLIGRLMVAGGSISGAGSGLLELSWSRLRDQPGDGWAQLGATVGQSGRALGWMLVVLVLPLVFPDGRRAGPRRTARWAWRLALASVVTSLLSGLFGPTQTDLRLTGVRNPLGLPQATQPVFNAVETLFLLMALGTLVLAVVCLVWRWRHSESLDRQRLLWFALAFVLPVLALLASFSDAAGPWLFAVVSLPLPIAIGVACLQHRLYDLDLVVNRSLTYGALSLAIAGLYALTVGGVGAMMRQEGAGWLPWVAAGVVAVSFAPLRDALQRFANRLTYGQWAQPAEVLAATGRRLSDATDVPGLLQVLADELGDGLRIRFVEIRDAAGDLLAVHGEPTDRAETFGLQAYGVPVGVLRVDGRDLRETDRTLVRDVSGQLGAVVHSAALLGSLRTSQERLVLAREEERRRLRRDLHDGLGPALAGLTLQVDTLRHQIRTEQSAADATLLDLRTGIQSTVLDVRRIVEGLRPPALDELGLVEALHQLVRRLEVPAGPEVEVTVDVPERLPAAVEVATYRIVAEAVTNAIKHARARHVGVQVAVPGRCVIVEVCDDGVGSALPRDEGVGLVSMRERSVEIGGSLVVDSSPGRGTRVRAELPTSSAGLSR